MIHIPSAIGVRLSDLMLRAPFLGSIIIPARITAALVLGLTFTMYKMVAHSWPALPPAE